MTAPEGSMSQGEVMVLPYSLVVGTTTRVTFDLPPGVYDLHVTANSNLTISSGSPQLKVEQFTDPTQSNVETMYVAKTTDTAAASYLTLSATVEQNVLVTPRSGQYIPLVIPYGLRVRYNANSATASGTLSGFLIARRR